MPLDRQEVFNRVVTHLRKQGERSSLEEDSRICLYRGPNGLKCAIGGLIADEHYSSMIESQGVEHPKVVEALKASGIPVDDTMFTDLTFLRALQRIHDFSEPSEWEIHFGIFARTHQLTVPEVST